MASLKRRITVMLSSRKLRPATQRPALLLILCALTATCCLLYSTRNVSAKPARDADLIPSSENSASAKMFAPIIPSPNDVNQRPIKAAEQKIPVPDPPKPIMIVQDENPSTENYEENEERNNEEEVGIFGSIATSLNLKSDSVLHKALNFADSVKKLSDDGPPVMESMLSIVKSLQSVSKKVSEINHKRNLKLVQGFVNSVEAKTDEKPRESFTDQEIPLGPEARKNEDFEKGMKRTENKPSLLNAIAQNVAPVILSEFSKKTRDSPNNEGPSIIEDIFINVGPQIIADVLGGRNEVDSDTKNGIAGNGFANALKFLTPIVQSVVKQQDNRKENIHEKAPPIMSIVGGFSDLLQGNGNGKRSFGDTMEILKPILGAIGPSLVGNVFDGKRNERSGKRSPQQDLGKIEEKPKKTFVDQMLNGMDEKTVGQAMGRALSSVLVKSLPATVRLPRPSEIRRPYDMAVNLVLGNPRNNSKEIWDWLRKISGEPSPVAESSGGDWVSEALNNPKRALYKEEIRHLYGLLNGGGAACRDAHQVGGVYDWKKDIILSSRTVCEDFDLWKAVSREAVSFGVGENWSFEEELVKRGNLRIHAVDPRLHQADHNHSKDIFFYAGRLSTAPRILPSSDEGSGPVLSFAAWLERWGLLQTPLHFVKIDLGGGEWEILESIAKDDPSSLEEVQQLSVTVRMDEAIRDPTLYVRYVEILETLASLGHEIFSVAPTPGLAKYGDPLVAGHEVITESTLAFVRT